MAKKQRPTIAAFKQQRLPAWKPILTPKPVLIFLYIIGIVFIGLGVLFYFSYREVKATERVRYDEDCDIGEECTIKIDIDDDMDEPVYLYYRLTNYHQNHRRYVTSRNNDQLRGEQIESFNTLNPTCDPRTSLDDSKNEDKLFQPCGLIAYSNFNDTYKLYDPDGDEIKIKKKDIAWKSDVEDKFGNPPKDTKGIFLVDDFTDEHFVNWMRVAAFPNFIKLWGIIEEDLDSGTYEIKVKNRYPVDDFDGKKEIFLSTTSFIGGKNAFLAYAYMAVGIITILFAIGYTILLSKARTPGDIRYLPWSNE